MSKIGKLLKCIENHQESREAIHTQAGMGVETPDVDDKTTEKELVCLQLSAACVLKDELEAEKKRLCE